MFLKESNERRQMTPSEKTERETPITKPKYTPPQSGGTYASKVAPNQLPTVTTTRIANIATERNPAGIRCEASFRTSA